MQILALQQSTSRPWQDFWEEKPSAEQTDTDWAAEVVRKETGVTVGSILLDQSGKL